MCAHAGDGEALRGSRPFSQVAAAAPFWIGHHRLTADLVEGDVLGRVPGRGRDGKREKTRSG